MPDNSCPQITLRPEQPGDDPVLFEIYASTRQEELDMTGWDEATRRVFLEMQFKAMRQGYASMYAQGEFSIILAEGQPVGRQVIYRGPDQIRVVDMALLPGWRNRGIGTSLMRKVLTEAERASLPVRLNVLVNSPALRLYQRLGFVPFSLSGIYQEMEFRPAKS